MASLLPYNQTLDYRKAKHLLRRATYNYSKTQIDTFVGLTAEQAINSLILDSPDALSEPYSPVPTSDPDGYWTSSDELPSTFSAQSKKRAFVTGWWWYNAYNRISIKDKLTFFLHTSFTVSKDDGINSTIFYDHLRLLDYYAFGNIKTLAKKITLDNAMLDYLDNSSNNANNPNENYAREFLELFTILKGQQIGEGDYTNYTEIDVQQAAKVFSGFKKENDRSQIDLDTNIPSGYANANKHDSSDKQFSSAFANQIITGRDTADGMFEELSDLVEMIFAENETAKAYCRKLYRFFVKSEWNEEVENDIISPLADILIANNYEILPVIRTLLKSEHFYDEDDSNNTDGIIGAIVKNPLQLVSEVCSLFNVIIPDATQADQLYNYYFKFYKKFIHDSYLAAAGLNIFGPDSVAGYPATYQNPEFDRQWFTSATIVSRYKLGQSLILGKNLIGNGSLGTTLDTVGFVTNSISSPQNPDTVVTEIAQLMYPETIPQERIDYFKGILLDGFDDFYWSDAWVNYLNTGDNTNVKIRLDELIVAMINAAEFQLM